ncbi:MAG: DUF2520 domain-containing protein [Bacteroidetes bacterium]|nr:DUF2520 domain-containing protein [Bacteroidota bacterium]
MQAVILGTGKVAKALGVALLRNGVAIDAVWGRNHSKAAELAQLLETHWVEQPEQLPRSAGVYFIAVSDDAVTEVSARLGTVSGIVVHVAGSLPGHLLSAQHDRHGVFYPLQTFSDNREVSLKNVPIFVQANKTADLQTLKEIASGLSSNVIESTDAMRKRLHLAAVFACNFVNALYAISAGLLEKDGLYFSLLHPLILETAQKATNMPPSKAQTGPARRGDLQAIQNHLNQLDALPREKAIYHLITQYILETYHPDNA